MADDLPSVDDAFDAIMALRKTQPAPPPADPDGYVSPQGTRAALSGLQQKDLASNGPAFREPVPEGSPDAQVASEPSADGGSEEPAPAPRMAADVVNQAVPHAPDEFDSALADIQHARQQRAAAAAQFLAWKANRPGVDAGTQLDVLRYSASSGLAPDFVAANLDTVKQQVDQRDNGAEFQALVQSSPALAEWASTTGVRPGAIKADLGPLTTIERALRLPLLGEAFRDAAMQQVIAARELGEYLGIGGTENSQRIDELEKQYGGEGNDYEAHNVVTRSMVGGVKMVPMIVGDLIARAGGKLLGSALAAPAEVAEIGAGGGPEEPAGDVTAMATEVGAPLLGEKLGSFAYNAALSVGPLNHALRNMRDSDGNPISPTTARILATVGGLGDGGLMAFAGGPTGSKLLASIPGADKVLGRYGSRAVFEAIAKDGLAASLDRMVTRYGTHMVEGGALMATQGAWHEVLAEVGRGHLDPNALGKTFVDHFVQGLQDMAFVSGVTTTREILSAKGAAAAVQRDAGTVAAIGDAAKASTTVQGVPEQMESVWRRSGQVPEAVKSAFIDKSAWDKYWQGQKADPAQAAKEVLGDNGEGYAAASTGADLVIPREKYVRFAGTDHGTALRDETRLYQPSRSPREQKELDDKRAARFDELNKTAPDELEESAGRVYEDFYAKTRAAGRDHDQADANARVVAAAMQSWAEQFTEGGSPTKAWDIYADHPVAVTGPRGRGLGFGDFSGTGREEQKAADDAAAAAAPTPEPANRQELRAQFDALPAEAKREKFFRDRTTGLYNGRGYLALPRDAARPFTAELGVEGAKPLNDVHGHDALDNALKVLGKVTRDAGVPDAVRTGNTIKLDAESPEQAQAIQDAASKALGHGVRATMGVADGNGLEAGARLTAAAKAHEAAKDELRAKGELPHRKAPAQVFTKGEPRIDFDAEAGKPAKEGLLHPDSEEAKAVLERAGERSKAFAAELAKAKPVEGAEISEHHQDSYAEHLEKHEPFDTIHLTPEGMLTEDGYHAAEAQAEKQAEQLARAKYGDKLPEDWRKEFIHYVSADARGIRDINDAFGAGLAKARAAAPTDEIMGAVKSIFTGVGGAEFNASWLHGDEFAAVYVGDRRLLDRYFKIVDEKTSRHLFWRPDGNAVIVQEGVRVAHGIAEDFQRADREALPAAKRDQAAAKPRRVSRAEFRKLESEWTRREGHQSVRVGRPSGRRGESGTGGIPPAAGGGGSPEGSGSPEGEGPGGAGGGGDRQDGPGRGGGAPGAGGAGPEERQLHVAPEVRLAPTFIVPTEAEMRRAEASISTLKSPLRIAAAEDFLSFVRDYLGGHDVSEYGAVMKDMPRDLEVAFADKFGIVDPRDGFRDTETLQRAKRGGQGDYNAPRTAYDRAVQADKREQFDKFARGPVETGRYSRIDEARRLLPDDPEEGGGSLNQMAMHLPEGGELALQSRAGRGYITFEPPGQPGERRRFDIQLEKLADRSTLPHETFHFLNQVMGELAQRPDAPAGLKVDYGKLLKFMDFGDHAQRLAEGKERKALDERVAAGETLSPAEEARQTALHAKEERATHAWEQMLFEGRAPKAELAGAFARFRTWMADIYRDVLGLEQTFHKNYGEEIGLTDEVRGVFDRILASDAEIRRTQYAAEAQPIPGLLEGMTPEERAEYEEASTKATEEAKTRLAAIMARAQRRETTKFFTDKAQEIRNDVNHDLDDPGTDLGRTYRALWFLREGELPEAPGEVPELLKGADGEPMKLDRKALRTAFGEQAVAELGKLHGGIMKSKGGTNPEDLASLLGFDNARKLVETLLHTQPRRAYLEGEVQKRLEDRYGPTLLDSPQALADAALNALHNDAAMRKALLERRAMAKLLNPARAGHEQDLDPAVLRAHAERVVAGLKVSDLTAGRDGASGRFLRAERTAAKRAREAAEAGKMAEALGHADDQIFSMYLWRTARDAREDLETALTQMQGAVNAPWRGTLGKADPLYREAHDSILQAVGMLERAPDAPAVTIDQLLERMGKDANDIAFDVDGLRGLLARPQEWGGLTQGDALNVRDAVKNIRKAANRTIEVQLGERMETTDKLFEQMDAQLAGMPETARRERDKAIESLRGKLGDATSWADASLMDVETMLDVLTANDRNSPLHQVFVDGQLKARGDKEALGKEFLGGIVKKWEKVPAALRKQLDEVADLHDLPLPPELADASWIDGQGKTKLKYALMIALNMGNAGNKERLLGGYGWNEDQVLNALDRVLPKEGWDFVQGVWDSLETLWPHIARVEEAETGLPPGKVAATEVRTKHGTYRGGYFPAKYDARTNSKAAQWQVEGAVANLVSPPSYGRASVRKGHAKARAEHFQDAVDLNWDVVPAHVGAVLHDVAYRAWVKDAARIVADPRFKELMLKNLGEHYLAQFDPWLKAVANIQATAVTANQRPALRAIGWLRGRIATAALGLNLPVALTHLSYPVTLATTGEVRPGFMAESAAKTWADWNTQRAWALQQSPELRFRAEQVGGLLRQQFDEMGAKVTPLERKVAHMSFAFLELGEKLTATPAWIARYRQEVAGGMDKVAAVREADAMIRRYYVSKSAAEVPNIIRDKSLVGGLFMFYGYMNKMWNVQRRWARDLHVAYADEDSGVSGKLDATARFAGKALALAVTQGIFSEFLGGKGQEDDETIPHWLFRKVLVFEASLVPFLGQAVDAALMGKEISVRQSPGLAVAQRSAQTIGQAVHGDPKAAWDALDMLGIGANLPTGAFRRAGQYLTGPDKARGPLDVAGGVVYGSTKTHPANPGTAAQTLISGGR